MRLQAETSGSGLQRSGVSGVKFTRAAASDLLVPALVAVSFFGLVVYIAFDQIALLPPRPPTPAETAAARPAAVATWREVYAKLLQRLASDRTRPPELGAVWSTRDGQVCGLVEVVSSAVPHMEPFYTVKGAPRLRSEDFLAYMNNWLVCSFDEWVSLHPGSYRTGFCATKAGSTSRLGQIKCQGQP